MRNRNNVPDPVVKRLSLYLRQLEQLAADGLAKISSMGLAKMLDITDAQVRKDLAYFGQFGRPGVGYRVGPLIEHLRHILGTDKTWKVVLMHAPAYSATPADDDLEMTENLRNELVPLFETESVHLVIQAHHNYYSRSLVDGITYLVLGGGGAALEDPDSTNEFVVTASKSHHFARIDAAGDTLTVTAIDADSNAIESFVISN